MVTVEGSSMEPTFQHGDCVAVRRTPPFKASSGDVVVVERPYSGKPWGRPSVQIGDGHQWIIKRVRAISGEPVPEGIPVADLIVPAGQLILLGDNVNYSHDSRVMGYYPTERLLGGVVRRIGRSYPA